jgi:hypothetical protein
VALTCRYFGITRQSFYTWKRRYDELRDEGLKDRSRRPKTTPNATHVDVIVAHARVEHVVVEGAGELGPVVGLEDFRLLPYLPTHLTFREIAARLFVSRNTVSSEVGSMCRRPGVSSRNGAVEHATVTGLLGA